MTDYLLLFLITFSVLSACGLIINYAKGRIRKTSHGLTGMCHKSGGTMCSSCSSQIAAALTDNNGPSR